MSYGFPPCGAWRSLVSALVWGTKGREFESRRPDCDSGLDEGFGSGFGPGGPLFSRAASKEETPFRPLRRP